MKDILFSLVVPVYNVENYVGRCLESILKQDYNNYEIICVNDGSTDNSGDILKKYSEQNPQIKVVTQKNMGLGEARNTGLKYITGDFVWFIDSDDWIEPGSLKAINDFHLQYPNDNVIIIDAYRINDRKKRRNFYALPPSLRKTSVPPRLYIKSLLEYNSSPSAWIKIFNKDIIKNYQFSKGFYEDTPLIRLYKEQNVNIGYLNKFLYNYFFRDDSIITKVDLRMLDMFSQYDLIYDAYKDDEEYKLGLSHLLFYWTGRQLNNVRAPQYENIMEEIRCNFFQRKKRVVSFWNLLFSNIDLRRKVKLLYYKFNYHL